MQYDVIIVGGGSAGSVLAARLSENKRQQVLLIEAGRDYPPEQEPENVRDVFYRAVYDSSHLWPGMKVHWSRIPHNAPPEHAWGRARAKRYEQARIMGGGSSVNAMVALRGVPADYDEWAELGAMGWGWRDVLPYFRMLEYDLDFDDVLHGLNGPIPVRRHRLSDWPPFVRAIALAAEQRGMTHVADMNGPPADGFCSVPMSSFPTNRVSTAIGYLTPDVRARENLRIVADARVLRLILRDKQMSGVVAKTPAGEETFEADEIILAAGALHSPALMMRAGLGPAEHLRGLGIDPVANIPGVGQNLHEHPAISVGALLSPGGRQAASLRAAANMALRLSSSIGDCPPHDIYMAVQNKISWHSLGRRIGAIICSVYKPFSRGQVTLTSSDENAEPKVEFNLLDDPRDMARIKEAMRLAHDLVAEAKGGPVVRSMFPASFSERVKRMNGETRLNGLKARALLTALDGLPFLREALVRRVVSSGRRLDRMIDDDTVLEDWIRDNATGFFHPVGTCRMGAAKDPMTVVDPAGRVRGVRGLRVADASVMPFIPRGNTNIPTIMIAEKIAATMSGARRG